MGCQERPHPDLPRRERKFVGLVDLLDGLLDFFQVALVLADVGAGWHQEGQEPHLPLQLRVLGEHSLVGAEAADDVLVGFGPVYADDGGLWGFACNRASYWRVRGALAMRCTSSTLMDAG